MPYFRVSLDGGHRYCPADSMKHAVEQVVDGDDSCIDLGNGRFQRPGSPGHQPIYEVRMITKEEYERIIQPFTFYGGKA